MKPSHASALLRLLAAIDSTAKDGDWIDTVCAAREKLPATVEEGLRCEADFCRHCGAGIPPRPGEGTCDRCTK